MTEEQRISWLKNWPYKVSRFWLSDWNCRNLASISRRPTNTACSGDLVEVASYDRRYGLMQRCHQQDSKGREGIHRYLKTLEIFDFALNFTNPDFCRFSYYQYLTIS